MWIYENLNGKISLVFGILVLLFFLATQYSSELNDGKPGIVSYIISNSVNVFREKTEAPVIPEMRSIEIFPLSEKSEKNLLVYASLIFSLISLIFAINAIKSYEFTLYPSVAVFAAFGGLVTWNGIAAIIYAVISFTGVWFVQSRKK